MALAIGQNATAPKPDGPRPGEVEANAGTRAASAPIVPSTSKKATTEGSFTLASSPINLGNTPHLIG